jgi:carboxyl-terminal processing protease
LTIRRIPEEPSFQIQVRPVYESFQRPMLRASISSFKIFTPGNKSIACFHLWSGTHDAFKNALKDAAIEASKKSDFFILDLRDGFGGASPDYLEPFFKQGESAAIYDKSLLVLINDGVRSDKEWISYVLKETKRATLIGSRTKGYFLGGRPIEILKNRFMLYLAVEEDVSMPKLEGIGVTPDINVSFELPYSHGHDPVLDTAIKNAK